MFISMINFLDMGLVQSTLRTIGALFCSFIYWFVVRLFNLFIKIAELDILSSTSIEGMYQRITMILTIVMTFYITFEFIKYVVSPDTITDKEKGAGGLIKRIFVVIVLIAFVPTIFSGAYKLQNKVIKTQVFSKIILGQEVIDYSSYGSSFAADALGTFYSVDYDNCGDKCDNAEEVVKTNIESIRQEGGTNYIVDDINMCGEGNKITATCRPAIKFNGLLGIIFGAFICYVLVMYCIDVGTRYAQLLFLQLISPIAIISYISPKKDGTFQKWIKQCVSTYLDLFIRIAIIYFILLIIRTLGDALKISELTSNGDDVGLLVYAFLVMGLMVFAQKAPKMLQELLPSTGGAASIGYGFGAKERFEPIKKSWQTIKSPYDVSKRAAGAIYSGVWTPAKALANKDKRNALYKDRKFNRYKAAENASDEEKARIAEKNRRNDQRMNRLLRAATIARSTTKAVSEGMKKGAAKDGNFQKGASAAMQSLQKDIDVVEKGGTVLGHDFRGSKFEDQKTDIERQISDYKARQDAKETVAKAVKEVKVMKKITSQKEDWDTRSFGDADARTAAFKDIEKATRVYAVSAKDATAKQEYETAIGKAIDKVYNTNNNPTIQGIQASIDAAEREIQRYDSLSTPLTVEQQAARTAAIQARDEAIRTKESEIVKIKQERDKVFTTITSEIGSDPDNITKVETELLEAQRISQGQQYQVKQKDGSIDTRTVDNATSNREFAEHIGDVADAAGASATALTYDEETRRAKANANGSGSNKG